MTSSVVTTAIPMPQSPVVDLRTGFASMEWYRFWNQPSFQSVDYPEKISTTDDLPEGSENLYFTVSRAQSATANLFSDSSTIDFSYQPGGGITANLTDLADSGAGTALVKITRDAKGRLLGTSAATTDDLTEGSRLYYTDARADARITLQKAQPLGLATLDAGGKLDAGQLPALAITETFVVASQAAMLALTAQEGDVAVRTDLSESFILTAAPASTLANWQELLTPTSPVTSVFGRVGSVSAASGDYTFAQIGSTPTTLAGYGITDAEPTITAGTAAQYWRGDKTWRDFATDVRATVLTGLSLATSTVIAAADSVLSALGKLQAQITALTATVANQGVPYTVATDATYIIPADVQALWTIPIELVGTASLEIDGALVEVV